MATLGNPKNTIEVLQKYQFNFQKKFGQNFLIDTGILEEIIEAAQITKDDFVLEIGPGIGTMTQYLCEAARAVVAVEIDTNLIPILKDTLAEYLRSVFPDSATACKCAAVPSRLTSEQDVTDVMQTSRSAARLYFRTEQERKCVSLYSRRTQRLRKRRRQELIL